MNQDYTNMELHPSVVYKKQKLWEEKQKYVEFFLHNTDVLEG